MKLRVTRPSASTVRRSLTVLAAVLALVGVGLLAYPFATDLWAGRIQRALAADLAEHKDGAFKVVRGEALTQLEIPKLGVDVVVVEGTSLSALRAGAGHYPTSALPGERGNVAIAGHRTTYGKPFNRLDELRRGDKVILTTPLGRYIYEIAAAPVVVEPDDWSVVKDYPDKGGWLTLTSCHPEGSADYRIVARARLIGPATMAARAGGGA